MYPEGTRSRDGRIGKLRSGAAALAGQHGLSIVPIYVTGTHDAMPPGQSGPPIMSASCRLGDNGEFYYHAYAMLTLKGKAADISYYQVPGEDAPRQLICVEQIPAD